MSLHEEMVHRWIDIGRKIGFITEPSYSIGQERIDVVWGIKCNSKFIPVITIEVESENLSNQINKNFIKCMRTNPSLHIHHFLNKDKMEEFNEEWFKLYKDKRFIVTDSIINFDGKLIDNKLTLLQYAPLEESKGILYYLPLKLESISSYNIVFETQDGNRGWVLNDSIFINKHKNLFNFDGKYYLILTTDCDIENKSKKEDRDVLNELITECEKLILSGEKTKIDDILRTFNVKMEFNFREEKINAIRVIKSVLLKIPDIIATNKININTKITNSNK